MKYLEQIDRAIQFIEENLSSDLIIDEISKESGISKWHFQRVFKAITGETIKAYTLSRRISVASQKLLETNQSVLEIALEFNFDSHEVFTRAFQRVMGVSPKQFRAQNNALKFPRKIPMSADYLKNLNQGVNMNPKMIQMPELTVYGVSGAIRAANEEDFSENFETIPQIWQSLKQKVSGVDETKLQIMSSIGSFNEDDLSSDLEYFACISSEAIDLEGRGLEKRKTRAGQYAEFIHKGPIHNIEHTMNYIYGTWLPQSGQTRDRGPGLFIYPLGYDHGSEDQELRVLVPIKQDIGAL